MGVVRIHGSPLLRPGASGAAPALEYFSNLAVRIKVGGVEQSYRQEGAVTITYTGQGANPAWPPISIRASFFGQAPTKLVFVGNFELVLRPGTLSWYAEVDFGSATVSVADPMDALPLGYAAQIAGGASAEWYSDEDPGVGPHSPP